MIVPAVDATQAALPLGILIYTNAIFVAASVWASLRITDPLRVSVGRILLRISEDL